jgi:hypothetical protein
MNRSGFYAVIAILVIAVAGFGIYTYQQQTKPALEVRVDGQGLTVNGN